MTPLEAAMAVVWSLWGLSFGYLFGEKLRETLWRH